MRHHKLLMVLGVTTLMIGGCASGAAPRPAPVTVAPTVTVRGPASARPVSAELFGRTAQSLVGLFGQPALDVREGTARKLQFSGENCVLDAYLYPRQAGGEAVVTHVDARSPEGRDADRAGCVQALRRR